MSVHAEAEGEGRRRGSMLAPRRACAITGGLCGALDSLSRATLLSGAEDERDAWRRGTWRRVRVALRVFETKKMEGSKAAHRQTAYPLAQAGPQPHTDTRDESQAQGAEGREAEGELWAWGQKTLLPTESAHV